MLAAALKSGAKSPADVRKALSGMRYKGVAMTYRTNGRGDMAHDAVIVCYDGASHRARIAKRYQALDGVQ
jgi:branched-chain amino acid transport system substrate-binding protein